MRIWISAVCRSGSREAMRWPKALRQFIRASTRLRTWQPADRFHLARPGRRVSCRMSFRTRAAGQSSFHARPLQRTGMRASAPRSTIAPWHRLVSQAPSAVTEPISSSWGSCASRSGSIGLSPCRPDVNSTARTSPLCASMPIWSLRHCLRRDTPCLRACHSLRRTYAAALQPRFLLTPRNLMPLAGSLEPVALHRLDVDQQGHGTVRAAAGDLLHNPCLTSAERGIVRNRPVQSRHPDQAGDQPHRLPQWQAEHHLQRKANRRENSPPDCFLILLISGSRSLRRSQGDRACQSSQRSGPSPDRTRSRASRGGGGPHCSQASSSCASGEKRASA